MIVVYGSPTLTQTTRLQAIQNPEKVFASSEHMSCHPFLKVQLDEVVSDWKISPFIKRRKYRGHQTCKTVKWPWGHNANLLFQWQPGYHDPLCLLMMSFVKPSKALSFFVTQYFLPELVHHTCSIFKTELYFKVVLVALLVCRPIIFQYLILRIYILYLKLDNWINIL